MNKKACDTSRRPSLIIEALLRTPAHLVSNETKSRSPHRLIKTILAKSQLLIILRIPQSRLHIPQKKIEKLPLFLRNIRRLKHLNHQPMSRPTRQK